MSAKECAVDNEKEPLFKIEQSLMVRSKYDLGIQITKGAAGYRVDLYKFGNSREFITGTFATTRNEVVMYIRSLGELFNEAVAQLDCETI
jgi:hypothetical protein